MEDLDMPNRTDLNTKRKNIARKIEGITSMRKGTLNSMYQKVTHKNGETVMKGPYYVLTRKESGGKTITKSIPVKDVPNIQQEVDNYKEFRRLTDEYVEICEKISILAEDNDTKKNEL
jgi:hypothetical protein